MTNRYCIIMAGGGGTRLWPLSTNENPKQFIDLIGTGRTMIQQTFDRFKGICPVENFYVVTSQKYKDIVLQQLPQLDESQILLEPIRRNTAPCIAYVTHKITKKNPNAQMVVTPADQLITETEKFSTVIQESFDFIQHNDQILTLGIEPHKPETGYGYIQTSDKNKKIAPVLQFTEKPNAKIAKEFLNQGDYFWNSGMFFFSWNTIKINLEKYLPKINSLFIQGKDVYYTDKEQSFINEIYPKCESISIDYAIMEKTNAISVFKTDFGWSDLGTWNSMHEHIPLDKNNNAITSDTIILKQTKNCTINSTSKKLIVAIGIEDCIFAENDNYIMLCKKGKEGEVKTLIENYKKQLNE